MKHAANIITAGRIAAAIAMLFTRPLTAPFFVFYTLGSISDMVDGAVARKLGAAGAFGARLDSVADLLFLLSAAYKILPSIWASLPVFSLWAAAAIIAVKLISISIGAVKFRKLCFLHTYMSKATGAAVFLLPYFFRAGCFAALVYAACAVAFFAAAEELICVARMKEYDSELKSLLRIDEHKE